MLIEAEWPVPARGWPDWVCVVPYDGRLHPGAPEQPIEHGANCQRYAYAVVGLFGRVVAPLRSDELWADVSCSTHVDGPVRQLDLVLFNDTPRAWGAHVGVVVAGDRILHVSAEVGRPAVWTFADFGSCPRYRAFVGAKRVRVVT